MLSNERSRRWPFSVVVQATIFEGGQTNDTAGETARVFSGLIARVFGVRVRLDQNAQSSSTARHALLSRGV